VRKLNILIGCECSGIVRDEFIKLGHDAMSCDLQPCDRPGPHHQGDLIELLNSKPSGYYDLMIAHPVCTYLCGSGWHWHKKQPDRMAKSIDARDFFMRLWRHPAAARVALETQSASCRRGSGSPTRSFNRTSSVTTPAKLRACGCRTICHC